MNSGSLRHLLLARSALDVVVAALVGLVAVSVVVLTGLLARPEVWAAGGRFVLGAAVAMAGTSAVGVTLAASLGCGFWALRRLVESGELDALGLLGVGPRSVVRATTPVAVAFALVTALLGLFVEPAAWRAVHRVKGGPAASAAALGRWGDGETVVLGAGVTVARTEDGGWRVAAGAARWSADSVEPAGSAWRIRGLQGEVGDARWRVDEVTLQPSADVTEPRSPATRGPARLRRLMQQTTGAERERANLVGHRRLALPALAPCLYWLGTAAARGRDRTRAVIAVAAIGLLLFVGLRWCDELAHAGHLPGAVAAWLPMVAAAVLAVAAWIRR